MGGPHRSHPEKLKLGRNGETPPIMLIFMQIYLVVLLNYTLRFPCSPASVVFAGNGCWRRDRSNTHYLH
jgi:hypothetical protein